MVICPVAIAVGCRRCPIFNACPVKGAIGDYRKPAAAPLADQAAAVAAKARQPAAPNRARKSAKPRPKRKNR